MQHIIFMRNFWPFVIFHDSLFGGVWIFGVWVFGVWLFGVWVFGVWVFGVWVFGVWVFGVWVFGMLPINMDGLRNRSKLCRGNTNIENWIPDIENSLSISDIGWPNHGIENHTNWNRGRKIECRHRSLVLNYFETQEKQHFPCRNSCPSGISSVWGRRKWFIQADFSLSESSEPKLSLENLISVTAFSCGKNRYRNFIQNQYKYNILYIRKSHWPLLKIP